ncbi:FAD-dependent oxidoreductase [Amycolatopsis echigonensis]|uniref:NAD(P)-binding domain-containing protein n=1 Tax=Amycolatopsis echigonensis TaxID=2576905 RepID=A0A2N3WPF3_9PSEU|nr:MULTISPECIES: FAD-dependent oxidoreductase [Amycolatopsis]MBB2502006.1 NAD(P)-binding domain-containing protein [Amycolatopsis echigonensis]PKV95751.1 NADPH-dependent L-lysine 6-monooxygenase-like protein [Amycolatopsis niigatensis]
MISQPEVVVIGAGPYGLSIAAHLRGKGVRFRHFGTPMHLWRDAMPEGMFLKSQGFASNLSDPAGTHTLAAFCRETGREYGDYGVPVPLDTFVAYGDWFRAAQAAGLEDRTVERITGTGGGYELKVDDGEVVRTRHVVCAPGVQHFAHLPAEFARLPEQVCSHSSAHRDLGRFRGKDVIVVGAGQSALETATLLHERGASVRLVARASKVAWNGPPLPPDRPLLRKLREPEAGLGSGWSTWFYSTRPRVYRSLPPRVRIRRARTALGPAGASWLRTRAEGEFPTLLGRSIVGGEPVAGGARLRLRAADGTTEQLETEHVIAATGYRPAVAHLSFLDDALQVKLRRIGGAPWVDGGFRSSLPGLWFAGPVVASSFGPVMRFVYGADYAARTVAKQFG